VVFIVSRLILINTKVEFLETAAETKDADEVFKNMPEECIKVNQASLKSIPEIKETQKEINKTDKKWIENISESVKTKQEMIKNSKEFKKNSLEMLEALEELIMT
jgi:hypothetical protein